MTLPNDLYNRSVTDKQGKPSSSHKSSGQDSPHISWSMSPHEQNILRQFYDDLDIGIAVVNGSLDLLFINRWLQKKLPPEQGHVYASGHLTNLRDLNGFKGRDSLIEKLSSIVKNILKYKHVKLLSQAFHQWSIPLPDNRFPDGKMRQTCIFKPYCFASPGNRGESVPCDSKRPWVLIQIKDESDTVLRTQNLKRQQKVIEEKNAALVAANVQLDEMNAELLQLNNQLQQREVYVKIKSKMEALGCMSGGIAHDFNNFLSIIMGAVELTMDDIDNDHPVFELLNEIQKASHTASRVVKQILHYCHPDYIDVKKFLLNLDTIIRDQLPLLNAMVPATVRMTYRCHAEPKQMIVYAALSQIQDILIQLVRNAVDAVHARHQRQQNFSVDGQIPPAQFELPTAFHGKIKIHLNFFAPADLVTGDSTTYMAPDGDYWKRIEFAPKANYLILKIKDNGQGIKPANLERIFDPYYTTKDVGEGSGLGLSTVHGLVKHLGGGIRVQSEWGRGSCFEILLPLHTAETI